jgi:cyclopropane fatty-acyl-phospholipid synthase-like methyltransferase
MQERMNNLNTKEYWETRYKKGTWNKSGQRQTKEYALENIKHILKPKDFSGTLLDFGCANGDAIPLYKDAFPNTIISGIDISESAISICQRRFGSLATFSVGDYNSIKNHDLIIASHILEHLTNDRDIVKNILSKCEELYIFVPFKENPLYIEHVNYYTQDYFNEFSVIEKKIFSVEFLITNSVFKIFRNLLKGSLRLHELFSKEIIMFHLQGERKQLKS